MIQAAQPWLPAGAVFSSASRSRLKEVVAGWSSDWFATRDMSVGKSGLATVADDGGRLRRSFETAFARVEVFDPTHRLTGWALDAPVDQLALSDADRDLIQAFEQAMFDDLSGRVTRLVQQAGKVGEAEPNATAIDLWVETEDAHDLILIRIPRSAMITLSKSLLPAASIRPPIEGRLQTLFGSNPVGVRAGLGWTQTPVSDLRRLAIGDVLVLDRRVTQDALVYMQDSNAPIATATLTPKPSELLVSRTAGPHA